ncbi:MAG: DNA mismatch repair endonuclease MutL [Candidatus Kapabacteria bacterium]|nr:DNA mismatch repair endonuclease MutL [Candidatus Kapabacteria bacterium]
MATPMTDATIHILPDHLANQIAAGEVVQRPESVVKELVENAIDAGATSVTVVVKQAGKQLIQVIDDGIGMSKADLELATIRHATSKISSSDDLHAIRTLGFRGEALASVAAVADVEIRTRRTNEATGWTLSSRPGQHIGVTATACDVGTQVMVRNLFYNVPARRKFLKSDLTEFRHVSETMQKLALARPDRRVVLYDGNVLVFDVKPSSLQERIGDILAIDATQDLLSVDAEEGGVSVHGYVGRPSVARQQRNGQYLFLNGRPIASRSLAHAVTTAYEHVLDRQQHPVFVLHLTVDPSRVDVNVHPQKHEVKFDDERTVYLLMQQAAASALQKANVVPTFTADLGLAQRPLQSLNMTSGDGGMIVNRLTGEITPVGGRSFGGGSWQGQAPSQSQTFTGAVRNAFEDLMAGAGRSVDPVQREVLQAGVAYIVTASDEGIVVIDQQAAHERVLFERLLARHADGPVEQTLMFAVTFRVAADQMALLREHGEAIRSMGFDVEADEAVTVTVRAVPSDVHAGTEEATLLDMLRSLADLGPGPAERRREAMAAVLAVRQSIRRGDRLGHNEQQQLVRDLFACAVPHVTAKGRPTYIIVQYDELLRRFQ